MNAFYFPICSVIWLCITYAKGHLIQPLQSNISKFDETIEESTQDIPCQVQILTLNDVSVLAKGFVLIKAYNLTIPPTETKIKVEDTHFCLNRSDDLKKAILEKCETWLYDNDEVTKLSNGSVYLLGELLEPGTFRFRNGRLESCAEDYGDEENATQEASAMVKREKVAVIIGKTGCSISIIALIAHLVIFCLVPPLRNVPGYNLASLGVAFLFAYANVLIGQIPEVLGWSCVLTGVLQQYFFLAAFFWMNVMAFDVWSTLRLATTKLIMNSDNVKKKKFVLYSLYSWGVPLAIATGSILLDFLNEVPDWIRPQFGKDDTCYMNNTLSKAVFFTVPAFTLLMINSVFFVLSAFIIRNNTMKATSDVQKHPARLNFVLYVRLALMMGMTWLFGVIATVNDSFALWVTFDVMNSLQGLLLFILFTCSPKVIKHLKERRRAPPPKTNSPTTDKQITMFTKCESN